MSTFEANNATNTEANGSGQNSTTRRYRRRRRRRRWQPESSDSESDSDQSWHSPLGSMGDGICEQQSKEKERGSFEEIDLESGELELRKEERDCRICHMSLLKSGGIGSSSDRVVQQQEESIGMAIELGCSCKGDLAAAHKQCAETWFKTKGNTICEICGATALNVAGEQMNEANNATTAPTVAAPAVLSENQAFWRGRRVMNFLLASMVFAFVISWLFHFNILP